MIGEHFPSQASFDGNGKQPSRPLNQRYIFEHLGICSVDCRIMSALIVLGVALVVVAVILVAFNKKRPKNAPPFAHLGLPVIGNYLTFANDPVGLIQGGLDKYGPIFTVPLFHKKLTFLLGPEVSAPFFRLSDDYMSQPEVYHFVTPVFGKGKLD